MSDDSKGSGSRQGCIRQTFAHKLGRPDALLDLFWVGQVGICHEGAMESRPKVGEALGVVPAEVKELWHLLIYLVRNESMLPVWCRDTKVSSFPDFWVV